MSDVPNVTPSPETQPDTIKDLRRQADRAAELERQVAERDRKLAFLEAGIPMDEGHPGALLFASYQGEPTKEAVLAAAARYGITVGGTNAGAPLNAQTTDARSSLVGGQGDPLVGAERVRTDPYDVAVINKIEGVRRGEDQELLLAQGVAAVLGAAKLGDERVVIQPTRSGWADPRQYG